MRSVFIVLMLVTNLACIAQSTTGQKKFRKKLGLKAGYNWSYATASQSGVNLQSASGYMAGAFLALPSRGLGFRSEVVYSHQGYSFEGNGGNTTVLNDYIYLPQLSTFSIGKFFQLQLGAQVGILLSGERQGQGKDTSLTNIMNRLDYGFAGGVELNPVAGLIIGGRYNLGLGKLYKHYEQGVSGGVPAYGLHFDPGTTNLRNGVLQIFLGYKF